MSDQDKPVDPPQRGLRYNTGKTRFDLLPTFAVEQLARVFTIGANKYAPRNWEKGMSWTQTAASLERHLQSWKGGEDYDPETGLLHMAHVMCNAAFLLEYYKIYPQGDDRPHWYLHRPRIALDIDEVLADFVGAWTARFGGDTPEMWNFDENMRDRLMELKDDQEFWLGVKPLINPADIPFEPTCYITSRVTDPEITKQWIRENGFPTMPVITVGHNRTKVDALKENNIELFVDDRFENFVEINRAGICCYLFDAPHNRRYNVGYKRIKSLQELPLL